MPGQPTRTWVNVAVLVAIGLIGGGWLLTGIVKSRRAERNGYALNNLKQIGLGVQDYHDTFLRLPGNGTGVGGGLPSPGTPNDAPFFYQILPYIEYDLLYRTPSAPRPGGVKTYQDYHRNRWWNESNDPVTDFAVNLLALYGEGNPPTAANTKGTLTFNAIADGTSGTLLVGNKSLHPADYATTDPVVDDSCLKLSSGGTSTVGARYTVGVTTDLKSLRAPPQAQFLFPAAVRDQDAARGVRSDQFGGPSPLWVYVVFLDGRATVISHNWTADPMTIPPVPWGTPPASGTFDKVSQLRAALTPNSLENVVFE